MQGSYALPQTAFRDQDHIPFEATTTWAIYILQRCTGRIKAFFLPQNQSFRGKTNHPRESDDAILFATWNTIPTLELILQCTSVSNC